MAAITKDEKISLEIFEVHQRQLWQGIAGNLKAEKNDGGKLILICKELYANFQTMLKIRLQRIGKRGQAYFKVVVTEHTRKPKGRYLELLGSYDPHKNEMNVDAEKVKHWLSQGAKMSETVNNLLVGRGVIEGEKVRVWKPKNRGSAERPPADTETRKSPETKSELETQEKTEATETKPVETKEEIKEEKEEKTAPASTKVPA